MEAVGKGHAAGAWTLEANSAQDRVRGAGQGGAQWRAGFHPGAGLRSGGSTLGAGLERRVGASAQGAGTHLRARENSGPETDSRGSGQTPEGKTGLRGGLI